MIKILANISLLLMSFTITAQDIRTLFEEEYNSLRAPLSLELEISVVKKMKRDICLNFNFKDTIEYATWISDHFLYVDTAIKIINKSHYDYIVRCDEGEQYLLELENGELYLLLMLSPHKTLYNLETQTRVSYGEGFGFPFYFLIFDEKNGYQQKDTKCLPLPFPKKKYKGKFRLIIKFDRKDRNSGLIYSNWTDW